MRNLTSAKEAAALLKRSEATLERWRYKRIGPPFHKLVGRVMYDLDALDRWVAAQEQECDAVALHGLAPQSDTDTGAGEETTHETVSSAEGGAVSEGGSFRE